MSHHDHPHDHDDHHHRHDHDPSAELSFDQKLVKLLEHWIRHNQDHARTYSDWAAKAAAESKGEVSVLLNEAVSLTLDLSRRFGKALKKLQTP
ncbi:MAG: hypothetical protein MUC33_06515 [Desulfobacterales bacterium]|nr:hypothetical protein [Desulfobacterales bacterium]